MDWTGLEWNGLEGNGREGNGMEWSELDWANWLRIGQALVVSLLRIGANVLGIGCEMIGYWLV